MTGYIMGNVPRNCHPKVLQLVMYWRSIHPKGDHLILERLVLPLARYGENVDMVLGMVIARTVSGESV